MKSMVRIGSGAGMADDRIAPAQAIAERAALDYLVMECLAERTIARETLDRLKDPSRGYTPSLRQRIRAVLPGCRASGARIVTNMRAANPRGAAAAIADEA
ncbi:acyclic terpene utilization AtuA family protein, partial [Mesorhizobium sp. M4A.F.Ca.ET.020.02.1.1]|uniref:acyclic terpene utilization AtuA family protein n=1 Tax=Mesorhizobium sp. M4A.F.Ca.ET.020.02.1.1 TaxID=2496652 RepID=UPI000FD2C66C